MSDLQPLVTYQDYLEFAYAIADDLLESDPSLGGKCQQAVDDSVLNRDVLAMLKERVRTDLATKATFPAHTGLRKGRVLEAMPVEVKDRIKELSLQHNTPPRNDEQKESGVSR